MNKKIQVVIVNDQHLYSPGFKLMIDGFQNFEVAAIVADGKNFADYLNKTIIEPDLAFIYIPQPREDKIEIIKSISGQFNNIKCVVLTAVEDVNFILQIIDAGARTIFTNTTLPQEAEKKMIEVYAEKYATINHTEENKPWGNNPHGLSRKEIEFIKQCCSELAYKEIAQIMKVSEHTVEGYRESVFQKLHLKTRQGIILYAIKYGLHKIN